MQATCRQGATPRPSWTGRSEETRHRTTQTVACPPQTAGGQVDIHVSYGDVHSPGKQAGQAGLSQLRIQALTGARSIRGLAGRPGRVAAIVRCAQWRRGKQRSPSE